MYTNPNNNNYYCVVFIRTLFCNNVHNQCYMRLVAHAGLRYRERRNGHSIAHPHAVESGIAHTHAVQSSRRQPRDPAAITTVTSCGILEPQSQRCPASGVRLTMAMQVSATWTDQTPPSRFSVVYQHTGSILENEPASVGSWT